MMPLDLRDPIPIIDPNKRGYIQPRPETTRGATCALETGCGKLYATINFDESGRLIETFLTTGSKGGCFSYTEATSRMISLALRAGVSVEDICEQLNSAHPCPSYQRARGGGKDLSPGKSCASAIAKKLLEVAGGEWGESGSCATGRQATQPRPDAPLGVSQGGGG